MVQGGIDMSEKVEKLLKKFRRYTYAEQQYEKHKAIPQAGVADYNGMPSGSGAPEYFFEQVGKMADMGMLSGKDHQDYKEYKKTVEAIEGALDTLNDDERSIVKMKWMDN